MASTAAALAQLAKDWEIILVDDGSTDATGQAAAYRLAILHGLYGPGTRRVLRESGLRGSDRHERTAERLPVGWLVLS